MPTGPASGETSVETSPTLNGRRLKVLISAYACEPGKGSEPGIGWNMVRVLASRHDVWVITRNNNREVLEREIRTRPVPHLSFEFVDLPRWLSWWKRGSRGIRTYYWLWGIWSFIAARRLHARFGFDVVHHLTFGNYWLPTFLPFLGPPFVWGPVGGGESAPLSFWTGFGLRGAVYELLRVVGRSLGDLDPFVRHAARRSMVAFATTPATAARLRRLNAADVRQLVAVGLGNELEHPTRLAPNHSPRVRFLCAGRLLHWKGFHLAISAFHRAAIPTGELWIVGDGPERRRLERLARDLNLDASVKFLGELPRDRVLAEMLEADVLVHPSLHESGGSVCLESMAAEKPVICLDLGGPGVMVTPEVGMKISPTNSEHVTQQMAKAMHKLATDPELRLRLGRSARKRVEREYLWARKSEVLSRVYLDIVKTDAVRKSSPCID